MKDPVNKETSRTQYMAQGAIHDLWKGKALEDCEHAELEALVEWVGAELQSRLSADSVMREICGSRSPF